MATLPLPCNQPRRAQPIETDRYLIETESAVRHDADLEIRAGRARTAVWVMERIVKRDDKLADNFYVLGEAYRGLGPRTPEPTTQELSNKGKDETRKMLSKMTPEEYEAALLKAPGGAADIGIKSAIGGEELFESDRDIAGLARAVQRFGILVRKRT